MPLGIVRSAGSRLGRGLLAAIRRAFGEFLALPLVVLLAFVGLACLLYWIDDRAWSEPVAPEARTLIERILGDRSSISSLLSTIATSMITMTSITFSLLLVAVQQGASSLTAQVFDQFLRRRWNQFYFGFFVGLSTFNLLTLITVSSIHRPIFATVAALLLTTSALCMMVVLIYNTIDQMRPGQIVRAVHDFALRARAGQHDLLAATRRTVGDDLPVVAEVSADSNGAVSRIDVEALRSLAGDDPSFVVELAVVIGSPVAYRAPLARLRASAPLPAGRLEQLRDEVRKAVGLEPARDLATDAAYAVEQVSTMAWTSVSTAKSNPQPGLLAIRALTDIVSRWGETPVPEDPRSPVVYRDRVMEDAIEAFESLAVVASESMQHQTLAEIMRAFAFLIGVLPPALAREIERATLRSLSALGEHVPTAELARSLRELEAALATAGFPASEGALRNARHALGESIGLLNSRSTRVPGR